MQDDPFATGPWTIYAEEFWLKLRTELLPETDVSCGEGESRYLHLQAALESECRHYGTLSIGKVLSQFSTQFDKGSPKEFFANILPRAKQINDDFRPEPVVTEAPAPLRRPSWKFW